MQSRPWRSCGWPDLALNQTASALRVRTAGSAMVVGVGFVFFKKAEFHRKAGSLFRPNATVAET